VIGLVGSLVVLALLGALVLALVVRVPVRRFGRTVDAVRADVAARLARLRPLRADAAARWARLRG
jgi:hypothetical protein